MKIFILNGPSASGKTTLMEYLLLNDADFLEPIVSFTTRANRAGEAEGKDYYYISKSKYLDYRVNHQIVEETTYLDNHYGVTTEELKRVQKTGKNGLIIVDTRGIRTFKKSLGAQNVVSIFIYRDLTHIIESIRERDIDKEEQNRRIELAKEEMLDINTCDHVIYNISSLADAYKQLIGIIKKEINTRPAKIDVKPGQKYRHFTGSTCKILTTAFYTENYCPLVVYQDLQTGIDYARPYEMFCSKKELKNEGITVNRFQLIPPEA